MGETVRGGYYQGVNGKFHDANGNEVEERSDKARIKEVEGQKGELRIGDETPTGTATDPGPLGPLVPTPPAVLGEKSTAEKSLEKEGVRGGAKAAGKAVRKRASPRKASKRASGRAKRSARRPEIGAKPAEHTASV